MSRDELAAVLICRQVKSTAAVTSEYGNEPCPAKLGPK